MHHYLQSLVGANGTIMWSRLLCRLLNISWNVSTHVRLLLPYEWTSGLGSNWCDGAFLCVGFSEHWISPGVCVVHSGKAREPSGMPGSPLRRLMRGKNYIKTRIFATEPVWSKHWCGCAVPRRSDQSVPQLAGHMLKTMLFTDSVWQWRRH